MVSLPPRKNRSLFIWWPPQSFNSGLNKVHYLIKLICIILWHISCLGKREKALSHISYHEVCPFTTEKYYAHASFRTHAQDPQKSRRIWNGLDHHRNSCEEREMRCICISVLMLGSISAHLLILDEPCRNRRKEKHVMVWILVNMDEAAVKRLHRLFPAKKQQEEVFFKAIFWL